MKQTTLRFLAFLLAGTPVATLTSQTYTSADPVVRRIFDEGMDHSQVYRLSQALFDSIGPRLTGTSNLKAGNDWLVKTYTSWGIPARNEQYGSWTGWKRGLSHIDLLSPRLRTLEGTLLAWSPGTGGKDVTGPVILLGDVADSAALVAWLPQVKGRFVAISFPEPTCRPDDEWRALAAPGSFEHMDSLRAAARSAWAQRIARTGYAAGLGGGTLGRRLGQAGAAGIVTSRWDNNGWGTQRIFGDLRQVVPAFTLSCEDYGLVYRLAENNQSPTLRLRADAEVLPDVPVFNSIAEIKGSQKPNEYVMLSAHFDSWDAGSGTTDNGTGTITMLETMRILRQVYPNPKRTILAGHWASEEQGLNGSRAFSEDHPEVVKGLQALFNQDNGTGRIVGLSASGLPEASGNIARWIARIPSELTNGIQLSLPGAPAGGGSDNASFACYGAPAFGLGASNWDYGGYTWHTNRDTFDKIVWDDLRNNAILTAMLVYLASEDETFLARDQRTFDRGPRPVPAGRGGRAGGAGPLAWPQCVKSIRRAADYSR